MPIVESLEIEESLEKNISPTVPPPPAIIAVYILTYLLPVFYTYILLYMYILYYI